LGGGANDLRDGVASLNVADFNTGLVWDLISTGERIGAIYERMPYDAPYAFTYFVDAPLHCPPVTPGKWHELTVVLDTTENTAHFLVDRTAIYEVDNMPLLPESIQIGMGIMTCHPLGAEGSRSAHGQGLAARWRDIRVGTLTR
jgi:hypothetical protein